MKTIVLGLDGATLERILPGIERGELPGLGRMMREGAWGPLRSTVPPDSPSAWTSFATGLNPGRHGVYGFMQRRKGEYDFEIGSSGAVHAKTFWERAGDQGCRVGVINVPFTYPPRPVNGFVVAGMMTPQLESPFTHPGELRERLLKEIPDYSTSHGLGRMQDGDPRATLARNFASTISMRERAMRWLAATYQPDLLVCVFTVLDRLQHFLWVDDPAAPAEYPEAIAAAYRMLDRVVARTLEAAGSETLVVVVSDHGFEAVARAFYVNAWLAERGLLALTGEDDEPSVEERRFARQARVELRRIPGTADLRERFRARRLRSDAFVRAIDWRRTRAWLGLDRGLWLNVEGRDPLGTVRPGEEYERLRRELIAQLESLEDPETGRRVVRKVFRREEVYRGDETLRAPDLIVEPARGAEGPAARYIVSERIRPLGGKWVGPSAPISGHHTPEGVLFLRGGGVRPGVRLKAADIIDIAPTILGAMGLSGAKEMDGKPLADAFERPTTPADGSKTAEKRPTEGGEVAPLTDQERQQVEERLKNLGYLD